jgi:hypothetical protein
MRNEFNQQVNRAIAANNGDINGDINGELACDTNDRFLAPNLAGSNARFWRQIQLVDDRLRQKAFCQAPFKNG